MRTFGSRDDGEWLAEQILSSLPWLQHSLREPAMAEVRRPSDVREPSLLVRFRALMATLELSLNSTLAEMHGEIIERATKPRVASLYELALLHGLPWPTRDQTSCWFSGSPDLTPILRIVETSRSLLIGTTREWDELAQPLEQLRVRSTNRFTRPDRDGADPSSM